MSRIAKTTVDFGLLLMLFSSSAYSGESITPQKAEADANQLLKDYETLHNAIESLRRGGEQKSVATKGGVKAQDQSAGDLDRLTQFEKNVVAPIQARYDDYVKNYGNNRSAIDQKFQQIIGRQLRRRPSYAWEMLGPELEKARNMRSGMADKLVSRARTTLEHMRRLNKNIWAKSFDRAKNNLETALKIDPGNQEAKTLLANIDQEKAKALADLEAEIEKAEWKPHSHKFNGPGDPDDLARIVFEQLRVDDDGKISDSVLAVRINGDWRVWDEVLGVPKNYGLPVEVAYRVKDEPQNASVLRLTMVTRDRKKAPPFTGNPGVGDSYKIRISKVPVMGAGSSSPFILFRLGLAAVLLLSGVVAGSSLLQSLNPNVGAAIAKITPLKAIVGVVTLAVGGLFFIKNLLCLSPLADILPQVAAVVIGLLLGLELLLKVKIPSSSATVDASDAGASQGEGAVAGEGPAESTALSDAADKTKDATEAAAQKLQDMLATQEERIKSLQKHQVRLGVACIILGLLHLLAAGWWLF